MKFIYIASPYTKGDCAANVRASINAADRLARDGYVPFCPVLNHFWHLIWPHPITFWYALDLAWLDKCDALIRLPGESLGADAEVKHAMERGIRVFHSLGEFFNA